MIFVFIFRKVLLSRSLVPQNPSINKIKIKQYLRCDSFSNKKQFKNSMTNNDEIIMNQIKDLKGT